MTRSPAPAAPPPTAGWAPLRHVTYRNLWFALFASNIGTWMQTVGAQWEMGSLTDSALMVALVQTATTLPVVLVAFPAGVLGDIADRRRLMIGSQAGMLAAAVVLAALTLGGAATAWVILGLIFVMGCGQSFTGVAWQSLQPDLVPRDEIPSAAALGGVSQNLARAVGPALGGALVAATGAGWVFTVNAVSFLGVLTVLLRWRRARVARPLGPEPFGSALRAGLRYVRSSRPQRNALVRVGTFSACASGLWALLPVVARGKLGLGSGGYGLLLADVGVGAILGVWLLPRVRRAQPVNRLIAWASVAFAASCLPLAWTHSLVLVGLALIVSGMSWIVVLACVNGFVQSALPDWVRSRGMSIYQLGFLGGQALGGVLWGVVLEATGTSAALSVMAGGLVVVGVAGAKWWPLRPGAAPSLATALAAEPELGLPLEERTGPVMVTVEYRVPAADQAAFGAAMRRVARARRRTGASRWALYRDGEDPELLVETYLVPSWDEHVRQHRERRTEDDQRLFEVSRALHVGDRGPRARHRFSFYG
jgi:MFS family permease